MDADHVPLSYDKGHTHESYLVGLSSDEGYSSLVYCDAKSQT